MHNLADVVVDEYRTQNTLSVNNVLMTIIEYYCSVIPMADVKVYGFFFNVLH